MVTTNPDSKRSEQSGRASRGGWKRIAVNFLESGWGLAIATLLFALVIAVVEVVAIWLQEGACNWYQFAASFLKNGVLAALFAAVVGWYDGRRRQRAIEAARRQLVTSLNVAFTVVTFGAEGDLSLTEIRSQLSSRAKSLKEYEQVLLELASHLDDRRFGKLKLRDLRHYLDMYDLEGSRRIRLIGVRHIADAVRGLESNNQSAAKWMAAFQLAEVELASAITRTDTHVLLRLAYDPLLSSPADGARYELRSAPDSVLWTILARDPFQLLRVHLADIQDLSTTDHRSALLRLTRLAGVVRDVSYEISALRRWQLAALEVLNSFPELADPPSTKAELNS